MAMDVRNEALCKECITTAHLVKVVGPLKHYQTCKCERCQENVAEAIVEVLTEGEGQGVTQSRN